MKCKGKNGGEQHEIMAKANGELPKFCGECAAEPAGDEVEMVKCTACDTEILAKSKFCGECSAPVAMPAEQLEAIAADIATFAKAQLQEKLEPPTIEDVEIDTDDVDAILAKAAVTDEDGRPGIDATPVITEMLKAEQATQHYLGKQSAHFDKRFAALSAGVALMLKAVPALATMVKSVDARLEKIGAAPAGRRAVAAVTASPSATVIPNGDLAGDDLMAKALVAANNHPELLSGIETSRLETYLAGGATLKSISEEHDPALGARVQRAIASVN